MSLSTNRTLRGSDKLLRRRIIIAGLFLEHDEKRKGTISIQEFADVVEKLIDLGYLGVGKRNKIGEIVATVDPKNRGKIEMNRFIDWMNSNVDRTNKECKSSPLSNCR